MEALHEVQAAHFLGYRRISEFRRDLRLGNIPRADRELPGGPHLVTCAVAVLA